MAVEVVGQDLLADRDGLLLGLAAAGPDFQPATIGSLRRKVIAMPARLLASGRRRWLRAPTNWPWKDRLTTALVTISAIPAPT